MDAEAAPSIDFRAPAAPRYAAEWRRSIIAMALASVVVLGLFHELVLHAVGVWWRSQVFNHCFLVLPLAGYMAWQRRGYAAQFRPTPDLRFLLLLLPIGFGYLLVRSAGIIELQQHAVMAMLQVLFLGVLGWPAYRALIWPLLYLFFLVPSGEFLVPILQDYTAWFSLLALNATGIPVYADGTFLTIPNGNFEVAEACAGVRFLIATLAFGVLYADVMYRDVWRKLLFLAASTVVPIFANGIRAYGIVAIGYYSDNAAAVAADHIIYGWVFFSIVMVLLMLVGNRFRQDDLPYGAPPVPAAGAAPAASRLALAAVVGVALIAVAPAWARVVEGRAAPIHAAALADIRAGGSWRPVALGPSAWRPYYPTADMVTQRAFSDGRRRVDLFVAYFASQGPGKKLIGGENRFETADKWRRISGGEAGADIADAGLRPVVERHAGPGRQRMIWYVYWIDGQFVTSGVKAKLLQALASLKGGGRGAAIVALAAEIDAEPAPANAALADFAAALPPLSPVMRRLAGQP